MTGLTIVLVAFLSLNSETPVRASTPGNFTPKIVSGNFHSCFVLVDSTVKCWGNNVYGQLGDGTTVERRIPAVVSGLSDVVQVSAGGHYSCALLSDGSVKCWGAQDNGYGSPLNSLVSNTPVIVYGLTDVTQVSAGGSHSCALMSNGSLKCWGLNNHGQLGEGTDRRGFSSTPVRAAAGYSGVVQVSVGGEHTCVLRSNGTVSCWGSNASGQLGLELGVTESSYPRLVSGLSDVVQVSTGKDYSCALLSNGGVKCWGSNGYGQLGDGSTINRWSPDLVSGLSGVVQVYLNGSLNTGPHSCALLSNGGVKCWGSNGYGQLGDGSTINRWSPDLVSGLSGVVQVSVGGMHTCALLLDGSVKCWGSNSYLQLGASRMLARALGPVLISGLSAEGSTTDGPTTASDILSLLGNEILPTLEGDARAGQILSAISVHWPAGTTHTYRWYGDGVLILGETNQKYETTITDVGRKVSVEVTGHLAGYPSRAVTSQATLPIAAAFSTKPTLEVQGNPEVGSILTAVSQGSWGSTPDSLTYRWLRAGIEIPGATGPNYVATVFDAGSPITVKQIANSGSVSVASGASLPTTNILRPFVAMPAPTILGLAEVGQSLRVSIGNWDPAPDLTVIEWYRDGERISDQAAAIYYLQPADEAHHVTVKVTAIKSGYTISSTTSSAMRIGPASVKPPPAVITKPSLSSAPGISGSARVKSRLRATLGGWSGSSVTSVSYNWYRCTKAVRGGLPSIPKASKCSKIAGATKSTYKLTSRDRYKYVVARVAVSNGAGAASATTKSSSKVR